jgi:hypothetical protein
MSTLTLEVTLRGGEKKVFPLSFRASEYHQADSWHEFLIPCMDRLVEVHLEMFTGDYAAWETVSYHYLEGLASSGDVEADDFEEDKGYKYAWQMLLDGKPATYSEVDQSLNCDFWLHTTSSAFEGVGVVALDKTSCGLVLNDALYEIANISEELYGKVMKAIQPIFSRETDYMKITIDGIDFTFTLSRCEQPYSNTKGAQA